MEQPQPADLAEHIRSPLFFAHVRASSGTAVQESNCHPFRHDRWLWMHNGSIRDFARLKRDLLLEVDPELYPEIEGTTDSEAMFFLALTYGLRDDPVAAVERMVGFVEATAARHGITDPVQMTVATTEGERIWAFRYSTAHQSRTLFYSTDVDDLRALHPEVEALRMLSDEARLVVSEPLGVMPDAFNEVPESSYSIIYRRPGRDVRLQPAVSWVRVPRKWPADPSYARHRGVERARDRVPGPALRLHGLRAARRLPRLEVAEGRSGSTCPPSAGASR